MANKKYIALRLGVVGLLAALTLLLTVGRVNSQSPGNTVATAIAGSCPTTVAMPNINITGGTVSLDFTNADGLNVFVPTNITEDNGGTWHQASFSQNSGC